MSDKEYLRLKEIIEQTFKMEFVSDDQRKAVFASMADNKPKTKRPGRAKVEDLQPGDRVMDHGLNSFFGEIVTVDKVYPINPKYPLELKVDTSRGLRYWKPDELITLYND